MHREYTRSSGYEAVVGDYDECPVVSIAEKLLRSTYLPTWGTVVFRSPVRQ
jgi:hypothetical protein